MERGLSGATEDGRIILVIFTKRAAAIRVVAAREATVREKRCYRRNA